MKIDPIFPVCGIHDEDGGHLFFKCKMVKQAWSLFNPDRECSVMARMNSAKGIIHVGV